MPRPKNPVPTYRLHKQSGQAIVTVPAAGGGRRDITLGKFNSPESKKEYQRVLAQLEAGTHLVGGDITVNELCLQFWKHAETYYRDDEGKPTSELADLRYAIRIFREHFGDALAREFGPLAFKALREQMVKKGWARSTVNDQCGRVKRIVRFGVENELLPANQWEALRAVRGLSKGRTTARETDPIGPVERAHVDAVLPFLRPPVRALVELLALTGMRPGEACRIRPCDIDKSAPVWVYRPEHHKTKHRGKVRVIPLGTRAQEVLKPFEPVSASEHYFSPKRDDVARQAERHTNRKTPRWASHVARNAAKREPRRKRQPGERFTNHAVAVAVARAAKRAGAPHWHPNQLRHTFATEVRKTHGLEAAQVLLGHSRADVTQVYAERDMKLAAKVAGEMG